MSISLIIRFLFIIILQYLKLKELLIDLINRIPNFSIAPKILSIVMQLIIIKAHIFSKSEFHSIVFFF